MKIEQMLNAWANPAPNNQPDDHITMIPVHFPIESAAKLAALHEIYPDKSEAELASDLISHALTQMTNNIHHH